MIRRSVARATAVAAVLIGVLGPAWIGARQDPGRPVPTGLDGPVRPPADNPMRAEVIALGRRLFFDKALSRTGEVSCATCHDPERAFADARAKAVGVDGRVGQRNAPALINRGYGESFFWDGRAATLEAQVTQPITNPVELDSSVERVVELARRDRTYAGAFRQAFGRAPAGEDVARALASYVRSILSGDSRVDRYLLGDLQALSAEEQRGLRVFRNRGLCTTCHAGANLTDEKFHNTGVSWDAASGRFLDDGRAAVTKAVADRGAFRTPTLREIARTAPYMHDGSLATIEAVIDFYDQGGRDNPYLDSEMMKLGLSAADKAALAAFLRALTGTVVEGR